MQNRKGSWVRAWMTVSVVCLCLGLCYGMLCAHPIVFPCLDGGSAIQIGSKIVMHFDVVGPGLYETDQTEMLFGFVPITTRSHYVGSDPTAEITRSGVLQK